MRFPGLLPQGPFSLAIPYEFKNRPRFSTPFFGSANSRAFCRFWFGKSYKHPAYAIYRFMCRVALRLDGFIQKPVDCAPLSPGKPSMIEVSDRRCLMSLGHLEPSPIYVAHEALSNTVRTQFH
jgi:hypothetical protein